MGGGGAGNCWKMRSLGVLCHVSGEPYTGFGTYRPRENLKPHDGCVPSSAPIPPQGRLPPGSPARCQILA